MVGHIVLYYSVKCLIQVHIQVSQAPPLWMEGVEVFPSFQVVLSLKVASWFKLSYIEFQCVGHGVFNCSFVTSDRSSAVLGLFDAFQKAEHFPMAVWFRRESVGESFIACFASVVHTKLSVWVAHLTWGGRMIAYSDTSEALMVTKDSPSSSVSSFSSSSATTDMLNSLKAFTKFDPLSVTVAMMFSFDRPNSEWISSNISAMRFVEVRGLGEHPHLHQRINQRRWELLADWSLYLKGSAAATSGGRTSRESEPQGDKGRVYYRALVHFVHLLLSA